MAQIPYDPKQTKVCAELEQSTATLKSAFVLTSAAMENPDLRMGTLEEKLLKNAKSVTENTLRTNKNETDIALDEAFQKALTTGDLRGLNKVVLDNLFVAIESNEKIATTVGCKPSTPVPGQAR